jgi:hypothetical protein
MPSLAATLQRSSLPYPVVTEANVSIITTAASENFTAVRSPLVDTLQESLLAFADAAVFELDISLRELPELPESIQVHFFVLCISADAVRSQENCPVTLDAAAFAHQWLPTQE